eukprot:jgi/Orpsp1_1/1175842/evm.model.c7180000055413.1
MKTLTLFSTLLAVTAAKKCIVKPAADAAADVASDAEVIGSDDENPLDDGEDSADDTPKGKLPSDFKWGAATAAYQVEGAWNEEGRGESVWDHFTHLYPKNVESGDRSNKDSTNGNVACDSYHKFDEDIKMMKIMNANHYRFSISWSRLFPDGQAKKVNGEWNVNEAGAQYYDMVIDTLLDNDIIPLATLYHWESSICSFTKKYGG